MSTLADRTLSRSRRRRTTAAISATLAVLALASAAPAEAGTKARTVRVAADTTAPSAPRNVRVTSSGGGSVSLRWDASTDNVGVSAYRVWRGDSNYDNWVMVGQTTTSTLTLTDRTAPAGVKVHYGVRAVDQAGNISASSNIVAALTTVSVTTTTTTVAPATTTTTTVAPTTTTTVAPSSTSTPSTSAVTSSSPPFFPSATWLWGRLPANPVLDPQSSSIAGRLAGGSHIANIYDYGVSIYQANSSTPRHSVTCTMAWGTCPLSRQPVPIPPGARASSGSDGAMVIIDASTNKSYEFWQYTTSNGQHRASWGETPALSGDGRPGATGAALSRLAGVVTVEEMRAGRIPHALVFATDSACRSTFRFPAQKTDGSNLSGASVCIPEGARVQLDPSINVNALPGLTAGERIVARALQEYGAYAMDNGGARMSIIFQTPHGTTDPYPALGFAWDYFDMSRIPWNSLRVLRQWDGL